MPSPRCTSHMISVGEHQPLINDMRAHYAKKYKNPEEAAKALARFMDLLGIKYPCCRNYLLARVTLEDRLEMSG